MVSELPLDAIHTISLEPDTDEPLYLQLYGAIRDAVLARRFEPGTKLPSSRSFARTLGVSRNTVISAYDQLTDEGFLVRRTGSGSYVADMLPDRFMQAEAGSPAQKKALTRETLSRRGMRIAALSRRAPPAAILPFAPGLPDYSALPLDYWNRLIGKHWRNVRSSMLSYGHVAGLPGLQRAVTTYLRACRAVQCEPEQVIITAGAQQAMDLITRLLLDEGDTAWLEEPGYPGARGALIAAGARIVPVPVDREGMNPGLGSGNPRLIYVTPSHQYPMGVTLSLARRLRLLELADKHGCWLVEDDYDSEYRYDTRPLASLQGLDDRGRVLYVGTFSKVLFPSLRLGYVVVPGDLVDAFTAARSFQDAQPPVVVQAALAELIESGRFVSHIRRMRRLYAARYQRMVSLLDSILARWLVADPTPAGMHLSAWFRDQDGARYLSETARAGGPDRARNLVNDRAISEMARDHKLVLRPLSNYFTGAPTRSGFVLGYAGFSELDLMYAASRLRSLLEQEVS